MTPLPTLQSSPRPPPRRLARRLAPLLLPLALAPGAALASVCFPEYQSYFTWFNDARTQQFSYDLRDLCTTGVGATGRDYVWNTGACTGKGCMNNYTIFWTIGGNLSRRCNPSWTHFMSGGSIFQTWGNAPDPALNPPRADPETGAVLPVDPNCEILAHTRPDFDLQDPTNPATGGITLSYAALPDAVNDINSCPPDARYGETKGPRFLTVYLDCDPYGYVDLATPYNMTEPSQCHYALFMRSKAACGIAGDSIAAGIAAQQLAATQPGRDFGFTLLGTVLLFALQALYARGAFSALAGLAGRVGLGGGGGGAAKSPRSAPLAGGAGAYGAV
jgi:hypothetical protein